MKTISELNQMSREELKKELKEALSKERVSHDMAVVMGSLGVSPTHMKMYTDSIKKLDQ